MAKDDKAKNELEPDTLSRQELAKEYGYALRVIYSDPEIQALFERALNAKKGQWNEKRFAAALQNTDWWMENSESEREAFIAESMGGADWEEQQAAALEQVQNAATRLGANLSQQQLEQETRDYIYKGWNRAGRETLLTDSLSKYISADEPAGYMRGESGNFQEDLLAIAQDNGLSFSNDFYIGAAKSVASGLTTEDDWKRDMREQAASLWPTFGEKIKAGMNVSDLASGYVNLMAQTFDIQPSDVSLTDPYIKQAMGGVDEQGNPKTMGLWQFEQQLRNDPRWMKTKQANNEIADLGLEVLKMFGFQG